MILDGHNRVGEANGDLFLYRPLTRFDRQALWQEMRRMPEWIAERWERDIVQRQIILAEWDCQVRDMDDETYRTVATQVLGFENEEQEIADEENLAACVALREQYPWLAGTSCDSCRAYIWDPLTGRLWTNINDAGEQEPLKRPEGYPVLCEAGTCPKGHWSNPLELSETNRLVLTHYETQSGADDPVVNRTRKVIQNAIRDSRTHVEADGRAEGGGVAADQPRRHGLGRTGGGG